MTAEHKPIESLPGYVASTAGEVFRVREDRTLEPVTAYNTGGWQTTTIGGRKYRLSRLVCEAFHGPPPEGARCMMRDGDKRNLKPENLVWASRSIAAAHGRRVGLLETEVRVSNPLKGAIDSLRELLELHGDGGPSQGYSTETLKYTTLQNACSTCGEFGELGVAWPCETVKLAMTAMGELVNHSGQR